MKLVGTNQKWQKNFVSFFCFIRSQYFQHCLFIWINGPRWFKWTKFWWQSKSLERKSQWVWPVGGSVICFRRCTSRNAGTSVITWDLNEHQRKPQLHSRLHSSYNLERFHKWSVQTSKIWKLWRISDNLPGERSYWPVDLCDFLVRVLCFQASKLFIVPLYKKRRNKLKPSLINLS